MVVVVTTGAISRAKLQSNNHYQQTDTQSFYRSDALPVAKILHTINVFDLKYCSRPIHGLHICVTRFVGDS